ncbi:hypothetical protein BDB01DRAFT_485619 [Pilobolus umbonatus]|nr:hypothetical protein BDB01DRAFT_485619 [Pilobolus umbonatus]
MLESFIPEITFQIYSYISTYDIVHLGLASKRLRMLTDHPYSWRDCDLTISRPENALWTRAEIKSLIEPYAHLIYYMRISGVRDSVLQFILSHCDNLRKLTICGWVTLSDHSFTLPPTTILSLRTLIFIESPSLPNFITMEAKSMAKLLKHSPHLTQLLLGCDTQFKANTFLTEIENVLPESPLENFAFATKTEWLEEHLQRFQNTFTSLQSMCISHDILTEMDKENMEDCFEGWVNSKMPSEEDSFFISSDMALFKDRNTEVI